MKKIIACIGTFFALVALSTQAKNQYLLQTADRSAMEHWVDSVFETLSPKERLHNCWLLQCATAIPHKTVKRYKDSYKNKKSGDCFSTQEQQKTKPT